MTKTVHTSITRRDKPICDFCLTDDVKYRFPCAEDLAAVVSTSDGEVKAISVGAGDWCACPRCACLVEAGNVLRLVASVLRRLPKTDEIRAIVGTPEKRMRFKNHLFILYSKVLPRLGVKNTDIEFRKYEETMVELRTEVPGDSE